MNTVLKSGLKLTLHAADDPQRSEVESFIARIYRAYFAADLRHFAPVLAALSDQDGQLLAAAGYRNAADGQLFLESYLSQPVEALLGERLGVPVARQGLVEVGHLAAAQPGAGRLLAIALTHHLSNQAYGWVISTLTRELRSLFERMGVRTLLLSPARAAVLGEAAGSWGSYYEHAPAVLASSLKQTAHVFEQRLTRHSEPRTTCCAH
ncbi:MAG: hypothetical protein RI906_1453 [Pseudomonadota bacterium]|jgi:hypothetical protein